MHDNLRQMIRDLIEQELTTLNAQPSGPRPLAQQPAPPSIKEEAISLKNDDELAQFVKRVVALADDPAARAALDSGQHRFRLASTSKQRTTKTKPVQGPQADGATAHFERGVLTERGCAQIATGIDLLIIGNNVRITPLAGDWLRRKRITIKRVDS